MAICGTQVENVDVAKLEARPVDPESSRLTDDVVELCSLMDDSHRHALDSKAQESQGAVLQEEALGGLARSFFGVLSDQNRLCSKMAPQLDKTQLLFGLLESTRSLKFIKIDLQSLRRKSKKSPVEPKVKTRQHSSIRWPWSKLKLNDLKSVAFESPVAMPSPHQTTPQIGFTKINSPNGRFSVWKTEEQMKEIFRHRELLERREDSPLNCSVHDPENQTLLNFRLNENLYREDTPSLMGSVISGFAKVRFDRKMWE